MSFTVIHIGLSFVIGFILGSLFGMGVYKLRKPSPSKIPVNQRPEISQTAPKVVSKVTTLDIPRISPSELTEEGTQDSIDILSPASIPPTNEQVNENQEELQSANTQPDDATVLMQRPPPT